MQSTRRLSLSRPGLMLRLLAVAILTSSLASAQAGRFDDTFGDGGIVVLDGTLATGEVHLASMRDGGAVVAFCQPVATELQATVVRLAEDGAVDSGFGTDGVVVVGTGEDACARGVAPTPDGSVLVLGGSDYTVLKLRPDGTPNPEFGTDGRVVLDTQGSSFATAPGGEIIISGLTETSPRGYRLFRLLANGTLDPSFADAGVRLDPPNRSGGDLAVGPEGQVATVTQLVYEGLNETSAFNVGQVLADGSNATDFGRDGLAYNALFTVNRYHDLSFMPDGGIVVAGMAGGVTNRYFGLIRLTTSGAVDAAFSAGAPLPGLLYLARLYSNARWFDVEAMPDGRIVALSGIGDGSFILGRVLPDGTVDASFGAEGIAVRPEGLSLDAMSVAVQDDERTLVAGMGSWRGASGITIARVSGDRAVPAEAGPEAGEVVVSVWPNPSATGRATVRVSTPSASAVTVTVLDVRGRAVIAESRAVPGTETHLSLDLTSLSPGVYLVRAVTESGASTAQLSVVR